MQVPSRRIRLIAVTGGIGSGKSVICHILEAMGHEVYDCDSRAKRIMDSDREMMLRIAGEVCSDAILHKESPLPVIDRKVLAEAIFSDDAARLRLNAIVHEAVRNDIRKWADRISAHTDRKDILFIETAILRESGLDKMTDETWVVTAPEELRISRAMQRDTATRPQIEARVKAQQPHSLLLQQKTGEGSATGCQPVREIRNNGIEPVLPQILTLLGHTH